MQVHEQVKKVVTATRQQKLASTLQDSITTMRTTAATLTTTLHIRMNARTSSR